MAKPTSDPRKPSAVRLGNHLRRLRTAVGLSQPSLAEEINGYGVDMVSKVENGYRVPKETMYDQWLDACRASDTDRQYLGDLYAQAREDKNPVPEFFALYLSREKAAEYLLLWCPAVISGLFQIYDYAYAMFMSIGLDEDEAAEKATARTDRRAILDGPNAPHVTMLLRESVLHCQVGTAETMVKQVTDLLEMAKRRNVIVQVVRGNEYFFGKEFQFEIASGDEIPHTLVTYAVEDQTLDDKALVRKAITVFREVQGRALTAEESRALIAEAIEKWKSLLQQQ
jgi:transcriptional regulator with XRE-family HTH domain